jgi:D-alanyl-lipoteichoic acid acyltransferase DltB (MBOAT superfamily)
MWNMILLCHAGKYLFVWAVIPSRFKSQIVKGLRIHNSTEHWILKPVVQWYKLNVDDLFIYDHLILNHLILCVCVCVFIYIFFTACFHDTAKALVSITLMNGVKIAQSV